MNLIGSAYTSSLDEEILIKKLLITNDPDGRYLDSELLLRALENIMCYATAKETSDLQFGDAANDINNIEAVGLPEPLGHAIYKLSRKITCKCSGEGNLHTRTMILFDSVANYRWDAKLALVLAGFVTSYGEFWLRLQLYPSNPLAVSVAMLKRLPCDVSMLKPRFKALSLLFRKMVDVTKCIIKFEGLPILYVNPDPDDKEAIASTKSQIYIAAYWVTRSVLTCSSIVTDMIAMKPEQVNLNSTTIAIWELSSLAYRLSSICSRLQRHVDACHQQIEEKMHQKLINLFSGTHIDNQDVLRMLFALKYDLPLKKSSSQEKLGVTELKNKVVILVISKADLLPLEDLLLLVQKTHNDPNKYKSEETYAVVWVPMPFSGTWTDADERIFNFFSNILPWYSIWKLQLLNSAVVRYIKQAWKFLESPIMVVLDSQGMVTNTNAMDMVLIWGARAYPFSSSREEQLWGEENWTIQLLVNELDPLLSLWVQEGRNICIYESDDAEWIREINAKIKDIKSAGVQIEMVYVGKRHPNENARSILSLTKIKFFWIRLESMKRSKLCRGKKTSDTDYLLERVSELLENKENGKDWAIIGRGSSTDIVKMQGEKFMQCLENFSEWGENVGKFGLVGAIRGALESNLPAGPCSDHSKIVPYVEGKMEEYVFCEKCRHTMKKFIVYE